MKRKNALYLLVILCLLIGLFLLIESYYRAWKFAREDQEALMTSSNPLKKKQVVFIAEELGNPYWNVVFKGAKAAAGNDIWIDFHGPTKEDAEEQIRLIERAIASHVDGIITQGLDEDFVPVINKAIESGIPVITVDTDAPDSKRVAFVGTDNLLAGYQAGTYLKEHVQGPMKIGIVSGNSYGGHMHLRIKGFKNALKQREDCQIVSIVHSQINKIEAVNQTVNMLRQHPDINILFGVSALDGSGIVQALDQYFTDRTITVIAFDDMPETIELLKQQKIKAIVAQQPYQIGYQSIELMRQVLHGRSIPPVTNTQSYIIDHSSLREYVNQKQHEEGRNEE